MTHTDNPLYRLSGPPAFDQIRDEHVQPAIEALIAEAKAGFDAAEPTLQGTWEDSIDRVDALQRPLGDAWSVVEHLSAVRNSDAIRAAIDAVQPRLVALSLRVGQSRPLFDALTALRDGGYGGLSAAQRRVVDRRHLAMRLSGVGLPAPERQRFTELSQRLSELATRFSNNVLDATKAWGLDLDDPRRLDGLSEPDRALFAQAHAAHHGTGASAATGPWRVGLDFPSFRAVMDDAHDRALREEVYRAYAQRGSAGSLDNTPLIREILRLRRESAALLGFAHFGDMMMASKMATVASARALLEDLRAAAWVPGAREIAEISVLAAERGQREALKAWDQRYWRHRLREVRYAFSTHELRPYFPVPQVLSGLFALVERLFGVQVVAADGEVPVWHADVRHFRVLEGGETIARFYLDLYARPATKRGGAWMSPALNRRRVDGRLELPVTYLICNGTPPIGGDPPLMSFEEVETLFHEFGHGLHHMLTRVDVEDAAGTSGVEWDAIELPSQFMENWCLDKQTLRSMTRHVETQQTIPDALFEKLVAARTFFAGNDFLRQVQFGLTDLALHTEFDPESGDAHEVFRHMLARTSFLPPVDEDRFLCSFSHIFAGGYAAGYYSYKWAEVLSADAFAAFEEVGLEDARAIEQVGRRYRETVLALGGSEHPSAVYRRFRGRDATPDALIRHNGLVG